VTDFQLRAWIAAREPVKTIGNGLTFTVSKAGTAAWILRYRVGSRRRELTLGRYPDLSMKEAKRRAAVERVRVTDGVDVAAEKRRAKHTSVAAWTVRQAAEDYDVKTLAVAAPSTRKLYGGYMRAWILPRLGAMLVADVQPADIVSMLEAVSARGTGAMRTLHAVTRAVFDHACGRAIRIDNPAVGIKRKVIRVPQQARTGVALEGDQLTKFLRAIPDDVKGWALNLHLITGVRPGEFCAAPWSEFDLDAAKWTIDAARTKMDRGVVITLPNQAIQLLRKIKARTQESAFLFPAAKGEKDRPIPYQTYRAWLWRVLDKIGVERKAFKPHDLRRTMRSGLTKLGVRFEVAERAINHKLPGLAEIYDRNDYADERASALQRWADFLDGLRSASNVTPFRRARS
jgi:integrase